jgi:hypothetical protein
MRAAVVDSATYIVVNVIVADAAVDVAPDGCFLVDIENYSCGIDWIFDPVVNDFVLPSLAEEEDVGN